MVEENGEGRGQGRGRQVCANHAEVNQSLLRMTKDDGLILKKIRNRTKSIIGSVSNHFWTTPQKRKCDIGMKPELCQSQGEGHNIMLTIRPEFLLLLPSQSNWIKTTKLGQSQNNSVLKEKPQCT